jgi:coenzyme F420-reducing hydrogenase delta subunit
MQREVMKWLSSLTQIKVIKMLINQHHVFDSKFLNLNRVFARSLNHYLKIKWISSIIIIVKNLIIFHVIVVNSERWTQTISYAKWTYIKKMIHRVKRIISSSSWKKNIFIKDAIKNEHDVLKIDVFKFEDAFFDDKSIIVERILELDNECIIKVMIDNNCINYLFIDIDIAQKVCDSLNINFLKLNKSREMKNYEERRNKNIIHVIYLFMTIQNHTKSFIFIMIIKFN